MTAWVLLDTVSAPPETVNWRVDVPRDTPSTLEGGWFLGKNVDQITKLQGIRYF